MGVCSQLVIAEVVHGPKLVICHLRSLWATYLNMFLLIPCANDSQLIQKFA